MMKERVQREKQGPVRTKDHVLKIAKRSHCTAVNSRARQEAQCLGDWNVHAGC
jgi:hypothetical protein